MRAIIVCVDYADLLAITLKYNRHHFDDVMIVTTPEDEQAQIIARRFDAKTHLTHAFYERGELFNKWRALEQGLSIFGRHGWMTIMDADVMWPKVIDEDFRIGKLYSPFRKIWPNVQSKPPAEHDWKSLPNVADFEWAGYTQIFHCDDRALPPAPWHETNWIHAGGADSAFQKLWDKKDKLRPDWEVLHLGPPGKNWAGRATPRVDGSLPREAFNRGEALEALLTQRRATRSYAGERLPESPTDD